MLSKLVRFSSRVTKPFSLKFCRNPGLSSPRFNSSGSPCGPPAKPLEGSGGSCSKENPSSGGASGGTLLNMDKVKYCEGRRGRKRTSMYSTDTLMMHCEIWPILAVVALDMCGVIFMILWISQTRDEVKYFKNSKTHIESTDLLNPQKRKLYIENQRYKPMKELHELYKAMKEGSEGGMKDGRKCKQCKKPHCKFF